MFLAIIDRINGFEGNYDTCLQFHDMYNAYFVLPINCPEHHWSNMFEQKFYQI